VKIGDNATICDNVEIGDESIIRNDAVIGEPLAKHRRARLGMLMAGRVGGRKCSEMAVLRVGETPAYYSG
jgi:hypothetical protein